MPNQTATQENPATGPIPAVAWRIHALSVLPGHRLALTFRGGSTDIADFLGIGTTANPGIYAPLADLDFFGRVQIDLGELTWPNGADIDPAWLYENLATGKTLAVPF